MSKLCFLWRIKMQGIWRHFFWDIDMNKQSKTVKVNSLWCNALHWKMIAQAYLLHTEITKSDLNNHICQHCGMKTSTVTPSFYYIFNISLSCNNSIPSFIGNLWQVLLLGNHLNSKFLTSIPTLSYAKSSPPPFLPGIELTSMSSGGIRTNNSQI